MPIYFFLGRNINLFISVFNKEVFMALDELTRRSKLISDLEGELKSHPNSVFAFLRLGVAYRNAGRLEDAETMFQRALHLDPVSFDARLNLSTIYFQMGRLGEGITEGEKALKIRPNSKEALSNMGAACIQLQRWEEAAHYLEKALEIEPNMASALSNFVTVKVQFDELEEAIALGEKAVGLAPKLGVAHNNLAVAYYYNGGYDKSFNHLERAREIGYAVSPEFMDMVSSKVEGK